MERAPCLQVTLKCIRRKEITVCVWRDRGGEEKERQGTIKDKANVVRWVKRTKSSLYYSCNFL